VSKSGQKEVTIEINLPQTGGYRMFFNRFRIERERGIRFVQFGFFVGTDLIDSFSCSIPDTVLMEHKKRLLEYLALIGPDIEDEEQIHWKGCPARNSSVVDVINMAHRAKMSEIGLHGFNMHSATVASRTTTSTVLNAEAIACLRSEPHLQKQIIATLYEEG